MSNLFSLAGKTALITGAGRGIGRAMAIGMADAGADIVLISRSQDQLLETKAMIGKHADVRVLVIPCDVTDRLAIEGAVAETVSTFGAIDILLNNAGINNKKNFRDVDEEEWRKIIDTNLTGQFLVASAVAKQMIAQGGGRIINMASVGGFMALTHTAPYCASKGGIMQMTRVMAKDLADANICVNGICPGYIDTGLLTDPVQKQTMMNNMQTRVPLKRAGEPAELVGAAIYLASPAASYVTGSFITIDGGASCYAM